MTTAPTTTSFATPTGHLLLLTRRVKRAGAMVTVREWDLVRDAAAAAGQAPADTAALDALLARYAHQVAAGGYSERDRLTGRAATEMFR